MYYLDLETKALLSLASNFCPVANCHIEAKKKYAAQKAFELQTKSIVTPSIMNF